MIQVQNKIYCLLFKQYLLFEIHKSADLAGRFELLLFNTTTLHFGTHLYECGNSIVAFVKKCFHELSLCQLEFNKK